MSENAFNSRSKTVGELLNSNQAAKLVVPTFQRGYSWEKKHVASFWKDITSRQQKKYFLGPIVILNKSEIVIELLDGQQRLATATILFSVLRDIARELNIQQATNFAAYVQRDFIEGEDGARCLEMGEMDDPYFRETIQADSPSSRKPDIRSHRHIHEARLFLMQAVRTMIAGQNPPQAHASLNNLKNTLRSDLVMACITVDSDGDAFQIFETLNDRGLRLSVPDLLLNFLMRVAPETDRKQIRQVWNEMLGGMGKRDISRFLRHLWVSKYGDLKSEGLFSALKSHIEDKQLSSLDFVKGCAEECNNYVQLITFNEEDLGKSAPLVRSLLQEVDCQPALPMLLACYGLFTAVDFEKIVRWLLVFATRYSILLDLDASGLEAVLFELAREIRSSADKIKNSSAGTLAHIKETLKKNAPADEQIKAAAVRLILSPDSANYVVRRLADAMESKTKEIKTSESNVEHIFPRNPAENEWGGLAGQQALEPYLWHIGNLLMFGKRLNQNVGNKEFGIKRKAYKASELLMAQTVAKDYATWDKSTIEDRAKKLVPLMIEVWRFDNPSRV